MKRTPIVMGNWKMNGSIAMIRELISGLKPAINRLDIEVAVFSPYVYLPLVRELLNDTNIVCGAQDLSVHEQGAYTGEVSSAMLKDVGCQSVLVGHSERRQYHGEGNSIVADKVLQAFASDLLPVICVGETLTQREKNETEKVVRGQLQTVLDQVTPEQMAKSVIAYEPVWAIGTGVAATPEQAQAAHEFIRDVVAKWSPKLAKEIRIVYGGSVKSDNAEALFSLPDIDGGLIGGASLKAHDFIAICQAANETM